MKVLGLLSFYAEKPEHLTQAVDSLGAAGISHLVAVDGAYGLFPDGKPSSDPECHEALRDAARAAGIGLTLHAPATCYVNNEVEKRTLLFGLAHALAKPGEDWLWVHDADETVVECDPTRLRAELEAVTVDVVSVLHGEPSVRPRVERRLFRAHPRGITVRQVHYQYVNGDGDVLWGHRQVARELFEHVRVLHEPLRRDRDRNKARMRYYEDRLIMRAEPDLVV